MFNNSRRALRINGQIGEWFYVITGVRRGCISSPLLFAIAAIDWEMRRATHNGAGIAWVNGKKLRNFDFTDDIASICDNHADMQTLTSAVENESANVGLQINKAKCKVMIGNGVNETEIQAAAHIEVVEDFCYLGSYISSNGSCEKDVRS